MTDQLCIIPLWVLVVNMLADQKSPGMSECDGNFNLANDREFSDHEGCKARSERTHLRRSW